MHIITKKPGFYVLRLSAGEELMSEVKQFAVSRKIRGAWFWAIGAADEITIAFYDLQKRRYLDRRFCGRLEIVNVTGNIAYKGREIVVHAHGAFGAPSYRVIGGHVVRCRVSATCEICVQKLPRLSRRRDARVGLNLLL